MSDRYEFYFHATIDGVDEIFHRYVYDVAEIDQWISGIHHRITAEDGDFLGFSRNEYARELTRYYFNTKPATDVPVYVLLVCPRCNKTARHYSHVVFDGLILHCEHCGKPIELRLL